MLQNNMKLSEYLLYALISVFISFLLCAVFILIMGKNPVDAFVSMISGAFGTSYGICEIIVRSTPLILMGTGVLIAYKAGLMNLGGDGQFYMGAIASTMTAIALDGKLNTVLLMIVVILATILAGGIWGGIAGFFKAKFGTNEIIATLMQNYLALYFFRYLIEGPFMDPEVYLAQTAQVPEALRFGRFIQGLRFNTSIIVVIIVAALAYVILTKTVWGYNIDILGSSPLATEYAGINKKKYIVVLMFLSGALAGLAGCIEVFAIHYRSMEGITSSFGFVAVIVALLANKNPIGVVIAGLFVASIQVGANSMQVDESIPSSIATVIQAIIILLLMIIPVFASNMKVRKIEKREKALSSQQNA